MKRLYVFFVFLILAIIVPQQAMCEPENSPILATAKYNDIDFNIVKAEIINTEPAIFESPEVAPMRLDGYLLITLKIMNNGTQVINYRSTYSIYPIGKGLSLDDEFGSHYIRLNTKDTKDTSTIIYPGGSGEIQIAFQKPAPNAKHIVLSFPKNTVSGKQILAADPKEDPVVKFSLDSDKISAEKKEKPIELILGEEYRKDGLIITVKKAKLGIWKKEEPKIRGPIILEAQAKISGTKKIKKKVSMIAISYLFTNNTESKKIDFNKGFDFSLVDNFDNKYVSYQKPKDYVIHSDKSIPGHFPNIYPGESYEDAVFFETPISNVKYLVLTIDPSNIGIKNKIIVNIPAEKITK